MNEKRFLSDMTDVNVIHQSNNEIDLYNYKNGDLVHLHGAFAAKGVSFGGHLTSVDISNGSSHMHATMPADFGFGYPVGHEMPHWNAAVFDGTELTLGAHHFDYVL